jgi:hypothetical protein
MNIRKAIIGAVSVSLLGGLALGCKPKQTDNPDVAADYRDSAYDKEIVTGQERKDYADQGKGIKPKTLRSIEDTITTVYERDFERCLEDQMSIHETRFLRTVFAVEFRIDTAGQAGDARVLQISMSKQNAKGGDVGTADPAGMKDCIIKAIDEWEFDPAPEVDYVHTYNGQVGEAF